MKMMQTNVDAEVIQLSVYCDIIIGILKYIEEMSINKVMVFAYILALSDKLKNKYCNKGINIIEWIER